MQRIFRSTLIFCLVALSACMFVRAPGPEELTLLDNPPAEVRAKQDALAPAALRWLNETEASLLEGGRRLSSVEIAIAQAVGVQEPDRVRIVVLGGFPMPEDDALRMEAIRLGFGSTAEGGRTMGYVIMLKPRYAQARWVLAQELVHVAQQERMRREAFVRRFLVEQELLGYRRAPLELEANKRALEFR
jgi:hypothetical protein